jgi:basic membrane lipoprotein Med (substrate-binding protein (PBP1-ABC) superfamily)/DNA-binding SARP family transcriptional activator
MQFRILGAIEVAADGAAIDLGSPKKRALLAVLLLHIGEIVPTERLIDLLWGNTAPRTAAHSIQIYVSELRRALQPLGRGQLIVTRPPGYVLDAAPDLVDAHLFGRFVDEGLALVKAGDLRGGAKALRSALALWRGPALSDFVYEEFAQPYVRRLNDKHLDAIEGLAAVELELGQTSEALALLEVAEREDPLRERSRELLMLALYRAGRHAEALRNYQQLRELLDEELGLEPSPPLRRLQERILLHDPTLMPLGQGVAGQVRNPYKGLRPFGEDDADDFFGRDSLVDGLLDLLRGGQRLISLVGPSGAGKSSVVAAGVVPRLRAGAVSGSDGWAVASIVPGPDPLAEAEAAIARLTSDRSTETSGSPSAKPLLGAIPPDSHVLLVVDQFEEVFSAEEPARQQFLGAIIAAATAPDSPLAMILALRADYYDRPLLDTGFATVFLPSVVNVLPMTAHELEAAIVMPAEQVGVTIERSLLTEVIADAAGRPGGLPLLQYVMTELFDHRADSVLSHSSYRSLGGLQGVLSRQAEALFGQLDGDEQRVALQVFLRLVRLGEGTVESRRRTPLADLLDLDADPLALSKLLNLFGGHRLLSFDRDQFTGESTVEVAHEALFREWRRLAQWIDGHRAALRRRDWLVLAVEEWELAGRDSDYLLTGSRLTEFDSWRREGTLQLTKREQEFIEAGLARRQVEEEEADRVAGEQRRLRHLVALGAVALAAALDSRPPAGQVALFLEGSGTFIDRLLQAGFARAVADLNLVGHELFYTLRKSSADRAADLEQWRASRISDLRRASEVGYGLIVTFDMPDEDVDLVAREFPTTHFVAGGALGAPNVSGLTFKDHEPSYLAGAAAALKSQTGTIGFIGGVDMQRIWPFEAGYEAGAHAIDPGVQVLSTYMTQWPDWTGFYRPEETQRQAEDMYRQGADVIMHAAGTSGVGLYAAAAGLSPEVGRQLWAIGVDDDQYETIARTTGVVDARAWQRHILTSVVKRFDSALVSLIEDYAQGTLAPGLRELDLESGLLGISYSGGHLDDVGPQLEGLKTQIINGQIDVDRWPANRERPA